MDFCRKANPLAIRRPTGAGIIGVGMGELSEAGAIGVADPDVGVAAAAENHSCPGAMGRNGGAVVQAAVLGKDAALAGAEVMIKNVGVAQFVGGVIEAEAARDP